MNLSIIHNINQNVDISKWEGTGGGGDSGFLTPMLNLRMTTHDILFNYFPYP